jgi:thioredoxin-like negative regulator of GroEL
MGEAYLLLAKLSPLTAAANDGSSGLVAQAVRLRPHDVELCFAAGFECFRRQQPEAGLAVWRHAATFSADWERRIVRQVAPHADPTTLIQHLAPTSQALVDAAELCGSLGQPASKQVKMYQLARSKLDKKPADQTTSDDWFLLHSICKRLDDTAAADQAMDRFVAARGSDFGSRLEQARWYHETGRDDRAVRLLERCRAERPSDATLARLMQEIAESPTRPVAAPEQAGAGTRG